MQIFSFIGNWFGYLLWFFYELVKNYGVAIILFTIVVKLIMFPSSIKQQKSMAQNTRLAAKQKELQEKYGNDKMKLSEETQKLYEKENINPMGGCLPMILPLIVLMGIYWAVVNPLTNTLHLASSDVNAATQMLSQIPGFSGYNSFYGEIEIIKHFNELKEFLPFSAADMARVEFFSRGFNMLGLDLLGTPMGSPFSSMLWLIPVLSLVTSVGSQMITMKMQGNTMQGCMKWMMYLMPLFTAYIAYTVPAAVGFYWIISTVISFLQTVILQRFYNVKVISAKQEAARVVLREQEEALLRPIAPYNPKKLSVGLEKTSSPAKSAGNQSKGSSSASNKKKNPSKKKGNSGSYMGTSKGDK